MKRILFINDHPVLATQYSYIASTIADKLSSTGEYDILMFGVNEEYNRPYGINKNWNVHTITGESKENHIRKAIRMEKIDMVFMVGDVMDFIWAYSVENEVRYSVPMVLYTQTKEYRSHAWLKPYLECLDMVICADDYSYKALSGLADSVRGKVNFFLDQSFYKKSDTAKDLRVEIFGENKKVFMWNESNDERGMITNILSLWADIVKKDDSYVLYINTDDPVGGYVNIYRTLNELELTDKNVVIRNSLPEDLLEKTSPESMYGVVDCAIDISCESHFPRQMLESISSGGLGMTLDYNNTENKYESVNYIKCHPYYDIDETGNTMTKYTVDRFDFISNVMSLRRVSDDAKESDIDHIKENYSMTDFKAMIEKTISDVSDRDAYIENMLYIEEVKSEQ